ncbi:hypothetical protein LguiB_019727 [Lonicera macranthoides]
MLNPPSYPLKSQIKTLFVFNLGSESMADDGVFRSCLVWLAAVVAVIGLYTQSLTKMMGTYLFGMFGIAGILLPDWDFFDRPVSQWCSPVCVDELGPHSSHRFPKVPTRFRMYPIRLVAYITVYGFALYKWWIFVSS